MLLNCTFYFYLFRQEERMRRGRGRVRGIENRGEWGDPREEREASQVFFRTEAEDSSPTTTEGNGSLFQHRYSGQRLSGSTKGTATCFSTRAPDSFQRGSRADFISAPGNRTASLVTRETSHPAWGREGGLRRLSLLETCPSFNGCFNELFSRSAREMKPHT